MQIFNKKIANEPVFPQLPQISYYCEPGVAKTENMHFGHGWNMREKLRISWFRTKS